MPRKQKQTQPTEVPAIVQFEFERHTYQIDPSRKKVYRRFVEIETSRAAEIFSIWRMQHAS